jgi:hypothetical protein
MTESRPSSIGGALHFLAELSAVARECAASGAWNDELGVRRRQRLEARQPVESITEERQVKAL